MISLDRMFKRHAASGRIPGLMLASYIVATAAGCSWGDREEAPADAVVMLTLIATHDVNPNAAGVPSPIVVVFYELAEPQAFEGAEFARLFYDDGTALASDVRTRLEFRVEPGQIITTKRVLDSETRHLGFVAGYREIEDAGWRIVADVGPASARGHTLVVGARSLSLPEVVPARDGDSTVDETSGGVLDRLAETWKGAVDAVLPGSE